MNWIVVAFFLSLFSRRKNARRRIGRPLQNRSQALLDSTGRQFVLWVQSPTWIDELKIVVVMPLMRLRGGLGSHGGLGRGECRTGGVGEGSGWHEIGISMAMSGESVTCRLNLVLLDCDVYS